LVHGGRWNEAAEQARRIFELDPNNALGLGILVWADIGKGMYKEALVPAEKGVETSGRHPSALHALACAYALSGDTVRALKLLHEMELQPKSRPAQAWRVATVYGTLAIQDHDYINDHFAWLEKAYQEHDFNLVWSSSVPPPAFAHNPPDPRWIAFRKKLGLPP
jgi:hypothetical protein